MRIALFLASPLSAFVTGFHQLLIVKALQGFGIGFATHVLIGIESAADGGTLRQAKQQTLILRI